MKAARACIIGQWLSDDERFAVHGAGRRDHGHRYQREYNTNG